jgi:hypothetical protein
VAFDEKKNARNEAMKEHDIAPLRNAVIAVIQQTPMKVLLCPEDASQIKLNKEMFYDKLPEDVKRRSFGARSTGSPTSPKAFTTAALAFSATNNTARPCASATAFRRSSAATRSRRARVSCGKTSG